MRRIPVDFNTLNSTPFDVVKFPVISPWNGTSYNDLTIGERVLLYQDEEMISLQVEAIITERWHDLWLAKPDFATMHDAPLIGKGQGVR
jgi:hypothetical protein